MTLLHQIVAFRRKPHVERGEAIDLAYITPQLIVSSMPTTNWLQSFYRTGASDLKAFLSSHHGTSWRVWSLQMPEERCYEAEDFDNQVGFYPVPDHSPIPIAILLNIVTEIREYTQSDPCNVAVVHCKAGQGRSGSVACAYLQVHHGHSFESANAIYTTKRIRSFMGKGVSIPSQVRYLRYLDHWTAAGRFPLHQLDTMSIKIKCIILRAPRYDDIQLELADFRKEYRSNREKGLWQVDRRTSSQGCTTVFRPNPSVDLALAPDIQLRFLRYNAGLASSMATVWFNSLMEMAHIGEAPLVPGSAATTPESDAHNPDFGNVNGFFTCQWNMFEGFWGTSLRGSAAFESVEVYWEGT